MKNTKIALATLGTLLVSTSAHAAGFFIQEQSVSAGGAAYSGAATSTNDASTIFFNPAGMSKLSGATATLGVQLLVPEGDLDNKGSTLGGSAAFPGAGNDGGNPYNPTPVPSGFIATPVSAIDGLWLGFGVTAPFGLKNKYDTGYFARYDSLKTELVTTDYQPSVAYQVNNWISLGAGLNIQHAEADLTNAANLGGGEGLSRLKGSDWGYGYTLGAQFNVLPTTVLGLNYRSSVHYDLDGAAELQGLAGSPLTFTSIRAKAALVTPDIASIGLTHQLTDKWKVMGQANWFGWNNFNDITPISDAGAALSVTNQDYQTVWSYALGAEYAWTPEWTFRGGIQFDNTPTTDRSRTTRTPDGDRTWFSAGTTYKINDSFSIDGNLTYIAIADEDIAVSRNGGAAQVRADTSGSVGIVGLGLNYKF